MVKYTQEEIQAFKEEIELIKLEIKLEHDSEKKERLRMEIKYIEEILDNS